MKLKPYFYYRQRYNILNNSAEESKEIEQKDNNVSQPIENKPASEATDIHFVIDTTQHSRFQEVSPGIFQFKHKRPNMYQVPPALFGQTEEKKPEKKNYLKVGTFPGAHGLPVYQFT
jgi:hypothetical protein